jgi:hypothetical protein
MRSKQPSQLRGHDFLVHNGRKSSYGALDRTTTLRCTGCMYTTAEAYNTNILGFNGMGTLANYQDTQLNAMTNFGPWSAMSPGPPAVYGYLDPALQALQARGVGYLQTVNNWISGNRYRPFWATSPVIRNSGNWPRADGGKIRRAHTYDEPQLNLLPAFLRSTRHCVKAIQLRHMGGL